MGPGNYRCIYFCTHKVAVYLPASLVRGIMLNRKFTNILPCITFEFILRKKYKHFDLVLKSIPVYYK